MFAVVHSLHDQLRTVSRPYSLASSRPSGTQVSDVFRVFFLGFLPCEIFGGTGTRMHLRHGDRLGPAELSSILTAGQRVGQRWPQCKCGFILPLRVDQSVSPSVCLSVCLLVSLD